MALPSRPCADDVTPIGRDTEAVRLAALVDEAAAGAKRAALLLGAPGIGKSTLLRFARDRADQRGLVSSYVRVPATAGLPPRFPLGELLGGFLSAYASRDVSPPDRLRRVVATLTGATSVEEYAVSLPQIADALEEAGRLGPLGLFVDDYDWAPPEGTELLVAALRVVETPVCFIASARLRGAGDEPPSPLPAPTADLWIDHIEVRGLDPSAVGALAGAQLGGEVLPSLGDALFARTLGNPLFVGETLEAWNEQGALVPTAGYWGLSENSARNDAGSLRDMISARLSKLPEDALSTAGALAVVGREADFDEIAAASGITGPQLVDTLSLLSAEGFVTSEGHPAPRYRVAHPLYLTGVLDRLGATRVAALHGRIGEELGRRAATGHNVSASERAHHAVRALHPPRDLRALLASAAAEAESAGSHEEAAVWYGHLAELADDPRELIRALAGQASASVRSDPSRSVQLFTCALELEADPASRARLLLGRASAHRIAGMFDPAVADLEDALRQAAPDETFDMRHAIGVVHGVRGNLDDAEHVFRSLIEENPRSPQRWKAVGHLGLVAFVRGDLEKGAKLQEEAYRESDDPAYVAYLRSNLCWLFVLVGRWTEADDLLRSSLADAVSSGNIHDEATLASIAARLAAKRGDLAAAFDSAQRALRLASRLGNPADLITANDALATALLENGMPGEAAAILSGVLELDRPGIEPREYSSTYAMFGEASLAAGDLAGARAALEQARKHLQDARFWAVAVDRVEAQIDVALGDHLTALQRLSPWMETQTPIAFEQARILDVAAEALYAIGDRAAALTRAQEALRLYETLGAAKRAALLGAWLVERIARRPGRPRSTLPGRLTERETEILHLIVVGRSNREIADELFISLGTAKKHVENIMAKAGVSRRTELVPFAVGIGALAVEDLKAAPGPGRFARRAPGRRVIRLDRLERSEAAPTD